MALIATPHSGSVSGAFRGVSEPKSAVDGLDPVPDRGFRVPSAFSARPPVAARNFSFASSESPISSHFVLPHRVTRGGACVICCTKSPLPEAAYTLIKAIHAGLQQSTTESRTPTSLRPVDIARRREFRGPS
jgi:hypothetical protein